MKTTHAKYKSQSYGSEVMFCYNHRISEAAALTPAIGVRYVKFYDDGYKETGVVFGKLNVKKKSNDKLDEILGLRLSSMSFVNEITLLPEIHGFVSHDFIGKKPKIVATIEGLPKPVPTD